MRTLGPKERIWILSALIVVGLLALLASTCWLFPRPYFVREMDLEPDYYYNSLIVHTGHPPAGFHHPGTPVYYLGALLMDASGDRVEDTQRFFNLTYVVATLASIAALLLFVRLALSTVPLGVGLLALASIVLWPSFLTYLNHFGSESFIVAFGLPTVLLFWKSLDAGTRSRRWLVFLSGCGAGLCLATKMTFLPLVMAMGASCLAGPLLTARRKGSTVADELRHRVRASLAPTASFAVGTLLSFIVCTWPILPRLPRLAYRTLMRPEAYPAGNPIHSFLKVYEYLFHANPAFGASIPVILIFFATAVGAYVTRRLAQEPERPVGRVMRTPADSFDAVTAGLFGGLLSLAFCYGLLSSSHVIEGYEPGIGLRNVSPCALVLPFIILYTWRLLGRETPDRAYGPRWITPVGGAVASLILVSGLVAYFAHRQSFIASQLVDIAALKTRIEQLRAPDTRVAIWSGVSTDRVGGEAAFHFLGNMTYASDRFNQRLLDAFPTYAMFDIRYAAYLATSSRPDPDARPDRDARPDAQVGSKYGVVGDLLWKFINGADYQYQGTYSLVTGGEGTARVSLFVFPETELRLELNKAHAVKEAENLSEDRLLASLREETNMQGAWRERIAGEEYVFLADKPRASARLHIRSLTERVFAVAARRQGDRGPVSSE